VHERKRAGIRGATSSEQTSAPAVVPAGAGTPVSMYRRQVVESANSALKGAYADLSRGFFRVFGRTKISVLLGFTIAAYNLDRISSFRAKMAENEAKPVRRAKRRQGTWNDLITRHSDGVPANATGPPD
jgi:hypothetical protein